MPLEPPPTLICMPAPPIPEKQADGHEDPRETGAYIARLWQAWDDCHSKLGRVRTWWGGQKEGAVQAP